MHTIDYLLDSIQIIHTIEIGHPAGKEPDPIGLKKLGVNKQEGKTPNSRKADREGKDRRSRNPPAA